MPFYQPIHGRKFHAECSRGKKISCKHIPQEKKEVLIKGSEKKLNYIPNHPPSPKVKWLAPKGKFIYYDKGGREILKLEA